MLRRCGVYKLEMELFWKVHFCRNDIVVMISLFVMHSYSYYSVSGGNPKGKKTQKNPKNPLKSQSQNQANPTGRKVTNIKGKKSK